MASGGMSIFVKPWVRNARKAVLVVGFGWLAFVLLSGLFASGPASLIWSMIGAAFMMTMFVPVALLMSVLLPTYQARMIGIPIGMVLLFWQLSSQSADYKGFTIPPYMALWIVTFTAITLLLPQVTTVMAFFKRRRLQE